MRRIALALLAAAAVLMSGPARAQSPAPVASPSPAPAPGVDMGLVLEVLRLDPGGGVFLAQRGYDPHSDPAVTDDQAKEVEAMFGRLASGSFSDTDTTIKEFTKKYGKLLGLPDGQDGLTGMRKFREFPCAEGKWLQYCPQKDGLDFISSLMTYVFRQNGTLCAVVGRYRPVTGPVGGSLAREEAIRLAQERIKKDYPYQEGNITGPIKIAECLVDDVNKKPGVQRMISVTMDVGDPAMPKRVVMLGNGTVLYSEDGAYGGCTGKIFHQDPVTDGESLSKEDLPDIQQPDHFWNSYVINGKNVKVDSPMAPTRATAFFGGFSESPFEPDPHEKFAEINTYYHLTRAWARAVEGGITEKELAPFTPLYYDHWTWPECYHLDSTEEDVDPAVKAAKDKEGEECRANRRNNAWFDPTTHRLYFSSENPGNVRKTVGDKSTEKHPAYEGTVIAHEFGHWVHYIMNPHHNVTGNFGSNLEAHAVQEAVADVFAAITCNNPVIAGYFLGDKKRDITREVKYEDVIPLTDQKVEAGKKGMEFHDAGRAFSGAYWRIKSDMGEGPALKVLLAGMRMCHTPCRFQNMALATLAMDQLLNSSPQGRRMMDRFKADQMVQAYYFLNSP